MDKFFGCAVLDEIKATEDAIKSCYAKVIELEDKIKHQEISDECKRVASQELTEVKKLLATNKHQLSHMHAKGSRSYAIVAAVIFIGFLMYGLYAMFFMNIFFQNTMTSIEAPILDQEYIEEIVQSN